MTEPPPATVTARWRLWPLYGAGFLTAFGAHSIAASLGGFAGKEHLSLFTLGALLAVYDGAEVILKPVFGSLADRIGPRPVLIGGLLAFAAASLLYVIAGDPGTVWAARLAQGVAAAAFSPAAGATLGRLSPGKRIGRTFGGYGAFKSLGYAAGPLLGGILIHTGGYRMLFLVLTVLGLAVAAWTLLVIPAVAALPRRRQTLLDLLRRLKQPNFVRPTLALAGTTAAVSVGVGFLPVLAAAQGYGPVSTGFVISVLAATAALMQPWVGKARDAERIADRSGMAAGLALTVLGFILAAAIPTLPGVLAAAVVIGAGTALATPLAFAQLVSTTAPERIGQTMGAAEVGRELGDAGGPLLVGTIAAAAGLSLGLYGLAAMLGLIAVVTMLKRR